MEKRVFSNGLTSPMSSSGTVRPSPNHKQRLDIHSCEKIGKQSPLGYCSVTRKGISSMRQACKSLFDVSIIWGKYLMVGRNFSCISQSNRTEFWRDSGTARWAMLMITNTSAISILSLSPSALFPWSFVLIGRIEGHALVSSASVIFRAQVRTFSKRRNSLSIELFVVFSFFEYLYDTVAYVMSQTIHDNQLIMYVFIYFCYSHWLELMGEIRSRSIHVHRNENAALEVHHSILVLVRSMCVVSRIPTRMIAQVPAPLIFRTERVYWVCKSMCCRRRAWWWLPVRKLKAKIRRWYPAIGHF